MKTEKLKQSIKGDVMEEKYLREMYSVDASIYKMVWQYLQIGYLLVK